MRAARLVPVLLALVLSACGFQLQGSRALSPELSRVSVDFQAKYQVLEPPLVRALREQIERRGGDAGGGVVRLRIANLAEQNQVLSVGADGKVIEYLYTTTVGYELTDGGRTRIPYRTLSVSREYSFNNLEVLATEAEIVQLREQMQQELAELMLLQLEAELRQG